MRAAELGVQPSRVFFPPSMLATYLDVPAARPTAVLVPTLARLTFDKLVNTAVAIRAEKERPLVDRVYEDALDGLPGLKLHLNIATRTIWLLDLRPIPSRGRQITVPFGFQFLQHSVKALLELKAARQREPSLFPFEVILPIERVGVANGKFPAFSCARVAVCELLTETEQHGAKFRARACGILSQWTLLPRTGQSRRFKPSHRLSQPFAKLPCPAGPLDWHSFQTPICTSSPRPAPPNGRGFFSGTALPPARLSLEMLPSNGLQASRDQIVVQSTAGHNLAAACTRPGDNVLSKW